MAAKHTHGRLPLKLHMTVKEGVTNLEKKLFTVPVYARGIYILGWQQTHFAFFR